MNISRIIRTITLLMCIDSSIIHINANNIPVMHPQSSYQKEEFIKQTFNSSAVFIQQIDEISAWFSKKQDQIWNLFCSTSYQKVKAPRLLSFEPNCDFDDMIGLGEVKEEFKTILEYINDPQGCCPAKENNKKSWILAGRGRSGKTFSVECLCGEIAKMQRTKGGLTYTFIRVALPDWNEADIKNIINCGEPTILFIDEADLQGLNRVTNTKRLMSFLAQLQESSDSKKDPSKALILIAATDCPESFDKVLRQYGQRGKVIRFEYPRFEDRKLCLTKELAKINTDYKNFDIDSIAAKTDGLSYDELQAIIRTAFVSAQSLEKSLTPELLNDSMSKYITPAITL